MAAGLETADQGTLHYSALAVESLSRQDRQRERAGKLSSDGRGSHTNTHHATPRHAAILSFPPSLTEERRKKQTTHTQLACCQRVTLLLCPDFVHFQLFPPHTPACSEWSLRLDTAPTLHLDSRTHHGEREQQRLH